MIFKCYLINFEVQSKQKRFNYANIFEEKFNYIRFIAYLKGFFNNFKQYIV